MAPPKLLAATSFFNDTAATEIYTLSLHAALPISRRCPEGVAAPLGCVIFFAFVEIGICTSGAHGFPRVQGMGGITTPGARYVLPKFSAPACQSGLFAVF